MPNGRALRWLRARGDAHAVKLAAAVLESAEIMIVCRTALICLLCGLLWLTRLSAQPPAPALATVATPHPFRYQLDQGLVAELRLSSTPQFVVSGLRNLPTAHPSNPAWPRDWFAIQVQMTGTEMPVAQQTRAALPSDSASPAVEAPVEISDLPSLLGEFQRLDATTLGFTPRYPLSPHVVYRLVPGRQLQSQIAHDHSNNALLFRVPSQPPAEATRIAEVFPTSDQLPENLLKFYLHFSAPMSRGQAYQHIALYHGTTRIEQPFLELGEELWDTEQQRFTLFIHPGRIKHGLRSRDEAGPALQAGAAYTLRIDQRWQDAAGYPLAETFEKSFQVTSSDTRQLDPLNWQIEAPSAGGLEPVVLRFDEPLDHAMLLRVLEVKTRDGSALPGQATVAAGETEWHFVPKAPWKTDTYHIEVATILEDLCGNSLAKPFEVDLQNVVTTQPQERIAIEFIVK